MTNQQRKINVWYDQEGDYLDVTWGGGNAFYTATKDAHVMALVDTEGEIQGFKIEGISRMKGKPLNVDLVPTRPKAAGG